MFKPDTVKFQYLHFSEFRELHCKILRSVNSLSAPVFHIAFSVVRRNKKCVQKLSLLGGVVGLWLKHAYLCIESPNSVKFRNVTCKNVFRLLEVLELLMFPPTILICSIHHDEKGRKCSFRFLTFQPRNRHPFLVSVAKIELQAQEAFVWIYSSITRGKGKMLF